MPKQQDALMAVLGEMGFTATKKPRSPRLGAMSPAARDEVINLYRSLGGVHPGPPLEPRGWDSCFEGDLAIEYDESQHFNRYRATTLQSDWGHECRGMRTT